MLRTGFALAIALALPQAIGFLGALSTMGSDKSWFKHLKVAPWSPPGWVFGPVWTILYFMMGLSSFLIWRRHDEKGVDVRAQLMHYAVNLCLNGIWVPIFFGLGYFNVACLDLLVLVASTITCIVSFHVISRPAAYLLVPYFIWLLLAASLNIYISVFNTSFIKKQISFDI